MLMLPVLQLNMTFKDTVLIYTAIKFYLIGQMKMRLESCVGLIVNSLAGSSRAELPFN